MNSCIYYDEHYCQCRDCCECDLNEMWWSDEDDEDEDGSPCD